MAVANTNINVAESSEEEKNETQIVRILGKLLHQDKNKPEIIFDEISLKLRELLRADNFSILTGAGSSYEAGGITFSKRAFEKEGWINNIFENQVEYQEDYLFLLKKYETYNNSLGVEDFISFLIKLEFAVKSGFPLTYILDSAEGSKEKKLEISKVRTLILRELRSLCNLPLAGKDMQYHKHFIKRIISRPLNLRRTNLFTTNYDLLFEKAMDEMGIIYVDGFIGGLRRFFHSECFNYDYYYPAGTTEGKVSRTEKVIHYYKIHGSLNWEKVFDQNSQNVFGLEKISDISQKDDYLIYPTPMKEEDTIGFPYSELFRKFANAIQQPQSVLITYGYSFGDYHINRIIFEALTIPSFQLIVISYGWTDEIKKIYDCFKEEPSVSFIVGPEVANWKVFTTKLLPDIATVDIEEKYQKKINKSQQMLNELDGNK